MIKTAPTFARLATMVLFALSSFGALLYLWIAFGGAVPFKPQGYRFDVLFPEATQLAGQADVRISGVTVGKVVDVEPGPRNRTRATIELDRDHAPVARNARAMLRLKSLLGETYVELERGDPDRGVIPEGGELPDAAVSPTVELDEILRTFDAPTRRAFQDWMQASAAAMRGRGDEINEAFGNLPGFVRSNTELFATLESQQAALSEMVRTTGDVFDAVSERDGELAGLISATNRLFAVTGERNRDLAGIFEALPRFERESTRTLPRLTAFGRRAEPVVRRLQPAASEAAPAFEALDEMSPELEGLLGRLSPLVDASERGAPAFERMLEDIPPLLDRFVPFLRNANPMLRYIGAHRREVLAFFANTVAASLSRDLTDVLPGATEPVNYLRTAQTLSPEALAHYPRPLGTSRQNAYFAPGALERLASGLPTLTERPCTSGGPAPPAASIPDGLADLVRQFAFRTDGRDVAAPACRAQGPHPGFTTAFPQLRADE
jgi:virulence factor Mce-like protein